MIFVGLIGPQAADAQDYTAPRARRQFISIHYDWQFILPQRIAEHPLGDLLDAEVDPADPPYDYRTSDNSTFIDVLELERRGRAIGATVYPFGMSVGATFGIRGSIESLPDLRVVFDGPGALDSYDFTGGIAYDVGAGLFVADRAPGWGLGGYAFIIGGVGKITSDQRGGSRYFGEGGGGVQTGPFGLEISVKFGWNRFTEPVEHQIYTVPINLRATVSF